MPCLSAREAAPASPSSCACRTRPSSAKVKLSAYAFNRDCIKTVTARTTYAVPPGIPPVCPWAYLITVSVSGQPNHLIEERKQSEREEALTGLSHG
jgi:hypothetical protein